MMRTRPLLMAGVVSMVLGCAGVKPSNTTGGSGGGSGSIGTGSGGTSGRGGSGGTVPPPAACNGPCADFPADPVGPGDPTDPKADLVLLASTTGLPGNVAQIFGAPTSGNQSGGPCLVEPQVGEGPQRPGALFPNNWLRPRFRVIAPSGQNVFEFRIHADNQRNDLVVYSASTTWTMPKAMWTALASHSYDMPITVTVRGASSSGGTPSLGSSGEFTIAPAAASGSLVYWSTKGTTNGTPGNGDTLLSGFAVGDETVATVLTPTPNPPAAPGNRDVALDPSGNPLGTATGTGHCIGCHTSTPDGAYISYNDFYPWDIVLASGTSTPAGAAPPLTILTPQGYALINGRSQLPPGGAQIGWLGISTYSAAHWAETNNATTEHLMVTSWGHANTADKDPLSDLAWINISTTSTALGLGYGIIARTGDSRGAAAPVWGRVDGEFIIYTSTNSETSGRLGTGTADLYSVPWNNKAGGPATPVPGASDPAFAEYYPALTSDDELVAFNRIPQADASVTHATIPASTTSSWDGMYAQPKTEVFVTPRLSNSPVRLAANDAPSCMNAPSPGSNNTWAKWSPEVNSAGGRKYYWLIFSSWRDGLHAANGAPIAQLYVTGVVQTETGLQTYGAIYLWNQPADISNHTPAWDVFQIPVVQ